MFTEAEVVQILEINGLSKWIESNSSSLRICISGYDVDIYKLNDNGCQPFFAMQYNKNADYNNIMAFLNIASKVVSKRLAVHSGNELCHNPEPIHILDLPTFFEDKQ